MIVLNKRVRDPGIDEVPALIGLEEKPARIPKYLGTQLQNAWQGSLQSFQEIKSLSAQRIFAGTTGIACATKLLSLPYIRCRCSDLYIKFKALAFRDLIISTSMLASDLWNRGLA